MATNCNQLKLKASDEKYYNTEVVDIESRLGESIVTKDNELNYQYIDKYVQC